ncbi:hypothetical protein B296_00049464 [Ensete ventricosum]|uniref:GRAM domain-containing protein n=1 Tax=Ensete ventricosum TaxID=4639 RepID=A0A426XYJ3_ENSVE|nr:hypothetical protein B296_00049464 [Ensete ventricosum]
MEKEAKEAAHVTEEATWGTKLMGPPAAPWAHPENERAALWSPRGDDERPPYVLEREPVSRGPGGSPMDSILDFFNSWAKKAEDLGHNIWHNREHPLSLSLSDRCSTFQTDPTERLKKTFACYLSTTNGPVAGTLYLSNVNVAFCSDRPLSYRTSFKQALELLHGKTTAPQELSTSRASKSGL